MVNATAIHRFTAESGRSDAEFGASERVCRWRHVSRDGVGGRAESGAVAMTRALRGIRTYAGVMGNRLADALSPYLRAHAGNPVDWFPWGEDAFEEAQERDVPVLVSIGYATCHWCHVMARESFSDPAIARSSTSASSP